MTKERQLSLTRWITFTLVGLAAVIPFLFDFKLPTVPSKVADDLFNAVEKLKERDVLMLSFDFDPGAEVELEPMARSLLRQAFRKNLRVINLSLYMPQSAPLMNRIVLETAAEFPGKVLEGRDFVLLGFNPGALSTILGMGENIYQFFPKDRLNKPLKDAEAMKGVATLKDLNMMIDLAAGSLPDTWLVYGQNKHGFPMGLGCTAVMATDYYPYLESGQLVGELGGMAGAYRYEKLVGKEGTATKGMRSLSVIHLLIVALIVVGNIVYFLGGRKK